jgi:alkaline phosphatase D
LFVSNETMVMQFKLYNTPDGLPAEGAQDVYVNLDQWDGYQYERQQILRALKVAGVENFVTITGDLHSFIAGYLYENFENETNAPEPPDGTPPVPGVEYPAGVCFMAGSVTSSNLSEIATNGVGFPAPVTADPEAYKAANPHITFFDSFTHGYNILELTPTLLTCTMQPVNPIDVQEGVKGTPRIFTVPVNQYVIAGDA